MSIVCGKQGGGCGRSLVSSENLRFGTRLDGGVIVVVDSEHSEQAVQYDRVKSSKKNSGVPYKMHCRSCGASVGSTVIVGDRLMDSFAWDKSSLMLRNQARLPNKKWKDYLPFLQRELSCIDLTSAGNRAVSSMASAQSISTVYCQVGSITQEVYRGLIASAPRPYQQELISEALRGNTLVCLPTGSGKTLVAAGVIHAMKTVNPEKLALFVVNTVPLAHQQHRFLKKQLPSEFVVEILTGDSEYSESNRVRETLREGRADVFVTTCGKLFSMTCALERSSFPLDNACVIVLDEAHRATGNSPYANLIRQYNILAPEKRPLLLALTASPVGSSAGDAGVVREGIHSLNDFLQTKIAYPVRCQVDLHEHAIIPHPVIVTERLSWNDTLMRNELVRHVQEVARVLENLSSDMAGIYKISMQNHWRLRGLVRKRRLAMGKKDTSPDAAAVAEHLLQVLSSIELLEVVGSEASLEPLRQLLNDIQDEPTPMDSIRKKYLSSLSRQLLRFLNTPGFETNRSSRWKVLLSILKEFIDTENEQSRAIVFVRMRRTARKLCTLLRSVPEMQHSLNPQVFVGHSGRDGMGGWREQTKLLEYFRRGLTSLLIATSVLEEGLDVPACKLVVRFNGEVSLRSLIQSRGRASRAADSKYITVCHTDEEEHNVRATHKQEEVMLEAIRNMAAGPRSGSSVVPSNCRVKIVKPKTTAGAFNGGATQDSSGSDSDSVDSSPSGGGLYGCDDNGTEAEWGVDAAVAHVKASLDTKVLQCFDDCGRVRDVGPLPSTRDYRGLNISGFRVHSIGDILDVGWDMIKSWPKSPLWLNVAIGRRSRARQKLEMRNLKAGRWCGQNEFLEQISLHGYHWTSQCDMSVDFMQRTASFTLVEKEYEEQDCRVTDEITFNISWQLHDFVLVDLTSDAEPRVYFTLRQPPKLTRKIEFAGIDFLGIRRSTELSGVPSEKFGSSLVYSAVMSQAGLQELLDLMAKLKKTVWFTQIDCRRLSLSCSVLGGSFQQRAKDSENPDTAYALSCVASANGFWEGRFGDSLKPMLESTDEKLKVAVLYGIADELQNDLFSPSAKLAKAATTSRRIEIFEDLDSEHCWVKRVILTPSRVVTCSPDLLQKNRVLREYSPDIFLRVSIRDEDFSRLSASNQEDISELIARVHGVLRGRIVVGKFLYEFLTSTGSQIRDHSCWFVQCEANGNRAQKIRDWMGNFSDIHVVATYISRLGQSFSTSTATVTVGVSNWKQIPDIKENGYCFSDGVGTISQKLAEEVSLEIGCIETPSAFQIRFGGVKGVVAIDPNLKGTSQLCIRPSMSKFESRHRNIEILNIARPLKLYLNQQMIILLSNLGIRDETFMHLLFQHLHNLLRMMTDSKLAYNMVGSMQSEMPWKRLEESGLNLTQEPFFRSLLFALYRSQIRDVLEKARIPTDENQGRVLLGVVDETGCLEYGEVFVQISTNIYNTLGEYKVIEEVVTVAKAPCLHPGDPRILTAVDRPALHHHRDVIVFPGKGPRPHPDEMSGSDLDGDLYHVIWDPNLVPIQEMFEPMDYTAPEKKEIEGKIDVSHMVSFICQYIENDNLGQIDNAHKALADSGDVDSDHCLKLAELHSLAVDAPKTGQWAKIPDDIQKELSLKGYPDFMMQKGSRSYNSEKVLGKIYRESQKCSSAAQLAADGGAGGGKEDIPLDETFLWEGFEDYLPDARQARTKYNLQLLSIMGSFGIGSEAEAISGCIDRIHLKFGRERVEAANIIEDLRKGLVGSFVKKFHEDLVGEGEDARLKKASAWYYVTYHPEEDTETFFRNNDVLKMLSFPWVVSDILCEVRAKNAQKGICPVVIDRLTWTSKTILGYFLKEKHFVTMGLKARGRVLSELQNSLAAIGGLHMYGSSAVLTFETESDLDVVLIPEGGSEMGTKEQIRMLRSVRKTLKGKASKSNLVSNAPVPFLELTVGKFGGNDTPGCHQVDITVDPSGLLKANTVQSFILENPWLLPVLRLVVKWGRNTGLMGHKRHALIPTNALIYLFINMCIERGFVRAIPQLPEGLATRWVEFCEDPLSIDESVKMGQSLVAFFDLVNEGESMMRGFKIHKDLVKVLDVGRFDDLGVAEGWTLLKEQMHAAMHVLLLTGNAQALLSKSDVQRVFFIPRQAARGILGAEKQYKRWLKKQTGADVSIKSRSEGSRPGLILKASGSSGEVHQVDLAVKRLKKQGESMEHVNTNMPSVGPRFMEGSTELIIEGVESPSESVVLQDYFGFRQPHHDNRGAQVIRHDRVTLLTVQLLQELGLMRGSPFP
ncbi:hypothetical protein BSKO_02950 [Bryopsis sp. KO-2023]|nr:hypothetical protein BSKO_02950 [Bryopsis sp. KO-2023]